MTQACFDDATNQLVRADAGFEGKRYMYLTGKESSIVGKWTLPANKACPDGCMLQWVSGMHARVVQAGEHRQHGVRVGGDDEHRWIGGDDEHRWKGDATLAAMFALHALARGRMHSVRCPGRRKPMHLGHFP